MHDWRQLVICRDIETNEKKNGPAWFDGSKKNGHGILLDFAEAAMAVYLVGVIPLGDAD